MRNLPSQTEYCRIVNALCWRCVGRSGSGIAACTDRSCPAWPVRELKPLPDIFAGMKDGWYAAGREVLLRQFNGSVWFSDLRREIVASVGAPADPHWWGGLGPVLQEEGYEMSDVRRKSGTRRRNGAQERMWVKVTTYNDNPTREE